MDIALYCPEYGFYEKEKDNVGKNGDFFTSVSVGGLFGELLAFQFAEWLEAAKIAGRQLKIVEAGAHDGRLAKDILTWLSERRTDVFEKMEYCLVEPSAWRRAWQEETLKDFENTVRWVPEIATLETKLQSSETIIFSNELLDALPIHRFGWDAKAKKWFEWGVALEGGRFVWSRMRDAEDQVSRFTSHIPEFHKLLEVLPDGYVIESSPAAEAWWRAAASVLAHGKLMAIDYGLTDEEQFSPSRLNGTLRGYHRHQVTDDVLANPGEQDLTAHVNFSAIQKIGEEAGLLTESFYGQPQFLTRVMEKIFRQPASFGEWGSRQTRQFQTLTHPEHLGRAFRVLVQSRQPGA